MSTFRPATSLDGSTTVGRGSERTWIVEPAALPSSRPLTRARHRRREDRCPMPRALPAHARDATEAKTSCRTFAARGASTSTSSTTSRAGSRSSLPSVCLFASARAPSVTSRPRSPSLPTALISLPPSLPPTSADRVTLDDHVQLALAVVLDRLSPAERTAFVLHDIFGFPLPPLSVRSSGARRRPAVNSRAGRALHREGSDRDTTRSADGHRERAAPRPYRNDSSRPAGGDISSLMEVLDPDVSRGDDSCFGPLLTSVGRPVICATTPRLFGPAPKAALIPMTVDRHPAAIAFRTRRVAASVLFKPRRPDPLTSGRSSYRQMSNRYNAS